MKAKELLFGVFLVSICILLFLHYKFQVDTGRTRNGGNQNNDHPDMGRLFDLVKSQNETISQLIQLVDSHHPELTKLMGTLQEKDSHIEQLGEEVSNLKIKLAQQISAPVRQETVQLRGNEHNPGPIPSSTSSMSSSSSSSTAVAIRTASLPLSAPSTPFEDTCERKYGIELVDDWRKAEQTWCESSPHSSVQSTLKCYPYLQEHKRRDGRGKDMFCEATNFIVDFGKIHGNLSGKKPRLGSQYLNFEDGSLTSSCVPTSHFTPSHPFMPHHRQQMRSFRGSQRDSVMTGYTVVNTPTYLLARDEDCENAFHSTADFMNMFLVLNVLNLSPGDLQVMLFDLHPDGPYMELIKRAYSPNHDVIRHKHYGDKKVMFKRLVFHLESPAGLIFPKVANPDPLRCHSTGLFMEYRKHILKAFNLWDVPPPPIPTVTLTLRHRTDSKNVGRVLANEKEIVDVLKTGNMMNLNVVDFAKMSFGEQMKLMRSSNVIIGVHGAGLMLIMFAAEEAVLVEMHPSYRQDRHFRHAARMTGKAYMPLRAVDRETCVGSSDNVKIPVEEFRRTVDGAMRLARSYDDGLSECGLYCPPSLLAIDKRLDAHYKPGEPKAGPINTRFPCG